MYYAIVGLDKEDPGLRDSLIAAHNQYCADYPRVRCGGPFVNEETGEMYGSVMVIEADTLEEARAWAREEPFCANLYESWDIHPYFWITARPEHDPLDMQAWPQVFRPLLEGEVSRPTKE